MNSYHAKVNQQQANNRFVGMLAHPGAVGAAWSLAPV